MVNLIRSKPAEREMTDRQRVPSPQGTRPHDGSARRRAANRPLARPLAAAGGRRRLAGRARALFRRHRHRPFHVVQGLPHNHAAGAPAPLRAELPTGRSRAAFTAGSTSRVWRTAPSQHVRNTRCQHREARISAQISKMIHAKHADVPAWLIGRRPPHHRRVPRASASVICAKILPYPATPHPSPVSQFIGSSLPITPHPPQPAPPPAPQPRHATAPVWRQPRHPCRGPPAVLPRQSAAPPAYGCGVGADSRSPEAAPALPLGPPQAPGCVLAAGTAASRTTTGRGTGRRAGMPWRSARSRIDRSIIRHSATALPMVRRCRSTDRTPRAALRKQFMAA